MTKKSKPGASGSSKPGVRGLTVKVKTARGRKISSQRWLQRQLNDPYVQEAQRQGLRSRAAFKFLEIQEKYKLVQDSMTVIDLGAAPGGWTQVLVNILNPLEKPQNKIIALDILGMDPLPGVQILKADFTEESCLDLLAPYTQQGVDVVLSDMAPPTTGHGSTDHLRIMAIVELAYDFAISVLKEGGCFVAKVFQGGTEAKILAGMKQHFEKIHHFKPAASRKESSEMYVIARGFRGQKTEELNNSPSRE